MQPIYAARLTIDRSRHDDAIPAIERVVADAVGWMREVGERSLAGLGDRVVVPASDRDASRFASRRGFLNGQFAWHRAASGSVWTARIEFPEPTGDDGVRIRQRVELTIRTATTDPATLAVITIRQAQSERQTLPEQRA